MDRDILFELTRQAIRKGGLLTFAKLAWPYVEAGEFQVNWHHKAICDALEKCSRGEIRKLVICVPPGSTKTLLSGVFWPAWDWLLYPYRRTIHTTYGGNLAVKAARQMRDLVNSPWYKGLTRGKIKIPYQNTHAAKWFENNWKGSRFSGSIGGEVTGRHAHILIGDDLNKAMDSIGDVGAFERAWAFWRDTLPTRQADPKRTIRVLIGQRLHIDDVPGQWIRSDPSVQVISIPMWGDPEHPYRHPMDKRAKGELMWPGYFDEEELEELSHMGTAAVAAQLQQDPIPAGGRLLKPEYLTNRYSRLPREILAYLEGEKRIVPGLVTGIYGDCTFKGKANSDFTVYQFWAAYQGKQYVIDQVRGQWGFREAKAQLVAFHEKHPRAQYVKLEDAANAPAIVDDLAQHIPGLQLFPMAHGGCLARQQLVEGRCWAAGTVWLPESASWMDGPDGFIAEHLAYDGLGHRHDDQVSTSGLALLDLSMGASTSYNVIWGKALGV